MVHSETAPNIDLRRLEAAGPKTPVLVCLGGGGTRGAPAAAALLDIERGLELGRGQGEPATRRFQSNDPMMSRRHAELVAGVGGVVVVSDLGSSNGTWVNGVRIEGPVVLRSGSVIFTGAHVFVYRTVTRAEREAIEEDMARPFGPVPTLSPQNALLVRQMRQLAPSELDLLLGGETGVGKEIYAEAIHRSSGRRGPFIAINCAALPEALVESELFGYARGAHPMADQSKQGLLEQAHDGTLFLDEIGDMPSVAQSKLLRFLQDGSFVPLGSVRPRRVNVRVIAATRRPITDIGRGLRLDLAARLGPHPLIVPPLRDRIEDVGPLACGFLHGRVTPMEAQAWCALFLHSWPGNVRELQKTMRFALVVAGASPSISTDHLPPALMAPMPARAGGVLAEAATNPAEAATGPAAFRAPRPSRNDLIDLLASHGGDVASVARAIGRQRTLVWRWLRREGVDPQLYRGPDNETRPTKSLRGEVA